MDSNDGNMSPEAVAYKLLQHVMDCEGRSLTGQGNTSGTKLSRNFLLDAYTDCLEAARGNRGRKKRPQL
jgi:hypothetical protein